ncbi:MAG: hypothetical protein IPL65_13600 [Lewinellaceae bacterium]|nr:hypothetical protein [Lewinellaceae bacterium]
MAAGCEYPENSGRIHKGKIVIQQTASLFTAGAVRTVTFENYVIDDVSVQGSKSWTNNGLNTDNLWSFTTTATGLNLGFSDGTTTSWNSNYTTTLIEGGATLTFWDNIWSTTGTASGTNRLGEAYTVAITQPLIKKAFCRWISEGALEFTRGDRSATFDFGDGSCDRFGKLTLDNGNTFTIRLRK